jgi:hypothetical protein
MSADLDGAQQIALEEFKQLRAEIVSRTTLGNQVVFYAMTAVAAGLAVFERFPEALLGVAAVVNFFWLMWLDHTGQVFKMAAYISLRLAPLIGKGEHGLLRWEHFMRELDAGGESFRVAVYGTRTPSKKKFNVLKTRATSAYLFMIFGIGTPALILCYFLVQWDQEGLDSTDYHTWIKVAVSAFVVALWCYAISRARVLKAMADDLDESIRAADGDAAP